MARPVRARPGGGGTPLAALQERVRHALRAPADVDLLLSPTLAAPQAPVGWFTETGDPADDFTRQKEFSPYCAVCNVTGQPAVTLPVGQTADGLPVGAMLAAQVGDDARPLAVAAQVEQAVGWSDRHPAIWHDAPCPVPPPSPSRPPPLLR